MESRLKQVRDLKSVDEWYRKAALALAQLERRILKRVSEADTELEEPRRRKRAA